MNKQNKTRTESTIGGQMLVIVAAGLLAGLASYSLLGPLMGLVGALFGLLWGWGLTKVAAKLAPTPERHAQVATAVLVLALMSTSIQLGGGIVYHLLLASATQMTDGAAFILRPEIGNSLNLFFMISNTISEYIIIPLALLLNWHIPSRRALVLTAALAFYADRTLTYTYFAPTIISLTAHQTADAAQRLAEWARYDGARLLADIFIPILTLVALSKSPRKKAWTLL